MTKKFKDFRPQVRNANRHTLRGLCMLDDAMSQDGYVAPMTAAADGEIIDGSARLERVADVFGTDVEPIVIEHDGTRPIVAVRTDISSADTPKAQRIALRANRIAQVNLEWNSDVLREMQEQGMDLARYFDEQELDSLISASVDSAASLVAEIDVSEVHDTFWISLTGPLVAQAEVLQALRLATAGISGVKVELGTLEA